MGFVYSECAFVENILHPQAWSPEPPPLSPASYTAEGDYPAAGAGWAAWTQCPLSLESAQDEKRAAGCGSS